MVAKNLSKIKLNLLFFLLPIIISGVIFELKYFFQFRQRFADKIYPNVYIDNKLFSGKSKKEIIDYFDSKSQELKKIYLTVIYQERPVATFSGEQINLKFDGETAAERAFLIGRSKHFFSRFYQIVTAFLNLGRFDFISNINYDQSLLKETINSLKENYDKPAKNALFKFENGKVSVFRQEENGLEIVSKDFLNDFDRLIQSLKNKVENKTITIVPKIIKPEYTLSSINNFGIEDLIAEGRSDFSHSIPERVHNLTLASSKFNGVLLAPEKTLSFNETVGDISSLSGYKPAYIIKDGKTILGDGGGVCQVSTTLFRSALNAGLKIIERNSHAYRVSYYENDMKPGFDATVFAPYNDLKIKNNTPAYILIQTEINKEKNLLFFRLYGKKDNRKIEISDSTIWDIVPPPEPKYQEDPTIKKGIIKQIDFPAWGGKAFFSYKVIKDNKVIIDEKFYSYYRPWQAVYLVGTGE